MPVDCALPAFVLTIQHTQQARCGGSLPQTLFPIKAGVVPERAAVARAPGALLRRFCSCVDAAGLRLLGEGFGIVNPGTTGEQVYTRSAGLPDAS